MTNHIGTSGWGPIKSTYAPDKYPSYSKTFYGTKAECNASASVYFNSGWTVSIAEGNPTTLDVSITSELDSGGVNPIGTTGTYNTQNWAFKINVIQKELLHIQTWDLMNNGSAWLSTKNLLDQDRMVLSKLESNPDAVMTVGTSSINFINQTTHQLAFSITGSGGWSGVTTSLSASSTLWNMYNFGQRTLPVYQPSLRLTMVVQKLYDLSWFMTNIGRFYSASSLADSLGTIPSNFYNVMWQDTDPSPSDTKGITYYYGWMKEPPDITQNGNTITMVKTTKTF